MAEVLDILHREFVYLWYYFDVQLRQIFGYWVLGILLGSCVSVFLKDKIHGLLRSMSGSRMGLWGIVPASLMGIASPLCMYGTIPLAASFSRSGMRDEWLAAFMMCSILLNPQLIVYSTALGTTALVVRIVSCFLCGIAAGLLIWAFQRGRPFFRFDGFEEPVSHDTDPDLECNLFFLQRELRELLAKDDVKIEAYQPLGHGNSRLLTHPVIVKLAEKYGKNAGQVILRFEVQSGLIVLPKSTDPERIAGNLDIFDFALTEAEMEELRALDTGKGSHDPEAPGVAEMLLQNYKIHD